MERKVSSVYPDGETSIMNTFGVLLVGRKIPSLLVGSLLLAMQDFNINNNSIVT